MRASGFAEDSDWCSSLQICNLQYVCSPRKYDLKSDFIYVRLTIISASYTKDEVE